MFQATRKAVVEQFGLVVIGIATFAVLWQKLLPDDPLDTMSAGVLVWWTALCAVSIFNLCGWRLTAAAVVHRGSADPYLYRLQRRQLILSAIYVAGCAFRSVLPRADVQRIGLVDSWASSVLVGRSVATVAELCFVAQWALLLYTFSRDEGSRFGVVVAWLLVPLITVAEMCSWYAVLTTSYLGNIVEESIWAISGTLLVASCLTLWPCCRGRYRRLLTAALVLGIGYVTFMCFVDVPMYASRWLADEAAGRQYLTLSQGLADVSSRWNVTYEWEHWRTEIPWMSLYFSAAVWCSIALVHAPRLAPSANVSRS
jgi:hypothetical protein